MQDGALHVAGQEGALATQGEFVRRPIEKEGDGEQPALGETQREAGQGRSEDLWCIRQRTAGRQGRGGDRGVQDRRRGRRPEDEGARGDPRSQPPREADDEHDPWAQARQATGPLSCLFGSDANDADLDPTALRVGGQHFGDQIPLPGAGRGDDEHGLKVAGMDGEIHGTQRAYDPRWRVPMEIQSLVPGLEAALRRAAEPVMARFGRPQPVREKLEQGPVSEADQMAHDRLAEDLPRLLPGSSVWSEEGDDRMDSELLWLVDPIDGTRDYLAGRPEFAISVGLTVHGKGVLGAVFNPAVDDCILACEGVLLTRNGQPIRRLRPAESLPAARVLVSRSELAQGDFDEILRGPQPRPLGSTAWKMALVAAGDGDLYLTSRPRHLWDVAAGAIIARAAGLLAVDRRGLTIDLSAPGALVQGVVVGPEALVTAILPTLPP